MHSLFHLGPKNKQTKPKQQTQPGNSFLRKYQELINQYKAPTSKPKTNFFQSHRTLSLQNLKAISRSSTAKSTPYKTSRHRHFYESAHPPKHIDKIPSEESLSISAIHSRPSSSQTHSHNPENNWATAVSKIKKVEHQSYHNVLLNTKLGLNVNTKRQLQDQVKKLKQQLLKETNQKAKTTNKIENMINKLSNTEENLEKTQKQKSHLMSQIVACSQEVQNQTKKNQKLVQTHLRNLKKIQNEKRLVEFYEKKNEQTKASLILQKYQLNITKDNYFIERNRLLKNEGKFEHNSNEREKICRSVSKNVRMNIIQKDVSV